MAKVLLNHWLQWSLLNFSPIVIFMVINFMDLKQIALMIALICKFRGKKFSWKDENHKNQLPTKFSCLMVLIN